MINRFKHFPYFLLLLPVFFVAHTLNEHYVPLLIAEGFELIGMYVLIALVLLPIIRLVVKSYSKATLVVFFLLSFQLFFGSMHDFSRSHLPGAFFNKYSVLVPGFILLVILLTIYLRRTTKTFHHLSQFLNIVFVVLIITELITLLPKVFKGKKEIVAKIESVFVPCDSCDSPDVYIIMADEYAGQEELTDLFGFDNSAFEESLKSRGFQVNHKTSSNYNATVYSMASMFSMQYLANLRDTIVNHQDMLNCRELIRENAIIRFFRQRGYETFNQTYFEFDDKKKLVYNPFYPTTKALYTSQTFTSRFRRNLGANFASSETIENIIRHHQYNNSTIDSATRVVASLKTQKPKLVYTHLAMPHHPYYYDSTGKIIATEKLVSARDKDKGAYLEYLLYANKRLLSLIDHITVNSKSPPVILLMSDHGFRQFEVDPDHRYFFMNLNAVLIPGRNYTGFYDGMSNVNQLRVLLNNQFGQRLPMLVDSNSFYHEPARKF